MRRFELVEGAASKFWEVEALADHSLSIRWGRIGSAGQSQIKPFADAGKAQAALDKLVKEKTAKGYQEVPTDVEAPPQSKASKPAVDTSPIAAAEPAAQAAPEVPRPMPAQAPVESLDAQSDRAFEGVRAAIADGRLVPDDRFDASQLAQEHGISERAAAMTVERLGAVKLVWASYGSATVRKESQALAQTLAEYASRLPRSEQGVTPAEDVAPWLAQGEPVYLPVDLRFRAFASRRHPKPLPVLDVQASWAELHASIDLRVDKQHSDPTLGQALNRMILRAQSASPPSAGDAEADAMLLALALRNPYSFQGEAGIAAIGFFLASAGLAATVDLYIEAQRFEVERDWLGDKSADTFRLTQTVVSTLGRSLDGPLCEAEYLLRAHLAAAPEELWAACAARIEAALPSIAPIRQPSLALLLPDRADISNAVALRLAGHTEPLYSLHYLLQTVTDPTAQSVTVKAQRGLGSVWSSKPTSLTLVMERGVAAADVLAAYPDKTAAGEALTLIGMPKAVGALARVAHTSGVAMERLKLALERWPLAGVTALAGLIAQDGRETGLLLPHLLRLLRTHRANMDALRPWLDRAAQALFDQRLALIDGTLPMAPTQALPSVLVAPPWLAKVQKKAPAVLALQALDLPAIERWREGAREQALELVGGYRDGLAKARSDVDALLELMGLERTPKLGTLSNEFKLRWQQDMRLTREAAITAIRDENADALVAAWGQGMALRREAGRPRYGFDGRVAVALPPALGAALWNAATEELDASHAELVMATLGLPAMPGLMALVRARTLDHIDLALNFAAVELALPAARAFVALKTQREAGRRWLLSCPEHAACGLIAAALGRKGEERDWACAALRLLQAQGHGELVLSVAGRYGDPKVVDALRAMLDEDPLDLFPAKRGKLPDWWQPQGWRRPLMLDGKALPDAALEHLGQMLMFPTNEGVYPGVTEVKQACQPGSLADFVWDVFVAWLDAGGSGKESWVMVALGLLGNDDTARRITPFIRSWPGESLHARAQLGLDTLAAIGSDLSLMLLNGIAQKLKFKGLQDKAREKINAIAEERGLSAEELDDRLAPDLGLDEDGSLVLDFGPRAFHVRFNEGLTPCVREVAADGALGPYLADLPKPKKSDDAELAKQAVERFKLLKKDARSIASQQLQRLELAMCSRRRWTPELFRLLLVGHPLLRHVVQRLVWGVYAVGEGAGPAGELRYCFRVAEDGSFADAEDALFQLPDDARPCIGLPHVLEIPPEVAAAFGQIFADYELLQPFAQLGRDSDALTAAETASKRLERWKGLKVPTGKVLGLVNRGWQRGRAQDGGSIWHFSKLLGGSRSIELHFSPGIIVGLVQEFPEQTLEEVVVGPTSARGDLQALETFDVLDAITASELIRDLDALRG